MADNSLTTYLDKYRPQTLPGGREPLPASVYPSPSGFVREKGVHSVLTNDLIKPTRTHYSDKYRQYPNAPIPYSAHSKKTPSGFTSNFRMKNPLTNECARSTHENLNLGWMTKRLTGGTLYNDDYTPLALPTGREKLPLSKPMESGYSVGNRPNCDFVPNPLRSAVYDTPDQLNPDRLEKIKKENPPEYANVMNNNWKPTMSKLVHTGQPHDPAPEVNPKCVNESNSGFATNTSTHTETHDDIRRFITHMDTAFHDPSPFGIDRDGHLNFQVQYPSNETAFRRDYQAPVIYPRAMYRRLDPYQVRSLTTRDYVTVPPNYL